MRKVIGSRTAQWWLEALNRALDEMPQGGARGRLCVLRDSMVQHFTAGEVEVELPPAEPEPQTHAPGATRAIW